MIRTTLQIRFNDMDPMQRVNNATYASYLELGRMDFCKKYLSIDTIEDIPFVLVRLEMDIRASLKLGIKAEVHTWVSRIGKSSWDFSAHICEQVTGNVFVEAKTVQVYFDYHNNQSRPIPLTFRNHLEKESL